MGRMAKRVEDNKKHLTKAEKDARQKVEMVLSGNTDNVIAPDWLGETAQQIFLKVANDLLELRIVSNLDVDALAMYADAYASYLECVETIRDDGMMIENRFGDRIAHPMIAKQQQYFSQMSKIANEFGLTPASRAKIANALSKPTEPDKPKTVEEVMFDDI